MLPDESIYCEQGVIGVHVGSPALGSSSSRYESAAVTSSTELLRIMMRSRVFDRRAGILFRQGTPCSSGLVAVHMACQALATGECDTALAGGVMLMTSPETMHYEEQWLTSKRGHCFAFDERADGFVRGEGRGMLQLKRLDDAIRDGDRILAVARGSAVTSDGQSERLTAPSTVMQQGASRLALARADVVAGQIGSGRGTRRGNTDRRSDRIHLDQHRIWPRSRPVRLGVGENPFWAL
ncbi:beta-ketoacyl synthase N-terminal-like domain-containing protein [Nocardia sp. CA-128927]|uniref:beta-ketoacyl synthase N-terminal-like domain-containing protein n=1 Tax=Nocardia sp. CA-128927 TaxID=3239975 RepID=UPI003D9A04C0